MIQLICKTCNSTFSVSNNRLNTAKYCCVACRDKNYKGKRFSPNTEFKQGQVFSKERNEKISKALIGIKRPYLYVWYSGFCEYCGRLFFTKIKKHRFCNMNCSAKGIKKNINPIIEQERRIKISNTLRGRIPKNLKLNIKSNNSYKQHEMFEIIKLFFSDAVEQYYVKTNTKRWLDVAIPSLKIDFEYNGKVHLMKSIQEKDKIRTEELNNLGWKVIIIDKNNFNQLEDICIKLKENGDV